MFVGAQHAVVAYSRPYRSIDTCGRLVSLRACPERKTPFLFLVCVVALSCRAALLCHQVCRYPAFEAEVSANPKLSMFILQGMVSTALL